MVLIVIDWLDVEYIRLFVYKAYLFMSENENVYRKTINR